MGDIPRIHLVSGQRHCFEPRGFAKGDRMTQRTIDLHVNPSEENIRVGPLMVRFLLTGDNSTGSIAAFELTVPGAQRLPAPAHSHDHYEETIYGIAGVLAWTVA